MVRNVDKVYVSAGMRREVTSDESIVFEKRIKRLSEAMDCLYEIPSDGESSGCLRSDSVESSDGEIEGSGTRATRAHVGDDGGDR